MWGSGKLMAVLNCSGSCWILLDLVGLGSEQ